MGVQGLPPNAAGIVNRAQEVLSDPELREQYDERLARRAPEPGIAAGDDDGAAHRAPDQPGRALALAECALSRPRPEWRQPPSG